MTTATTWPLLATVVIVISRPSNGCRRAHLSSAFDLNQDSRHPQRFIVKQFRSRVTYKSINFQQKLGLFSEQWQPKVVAEMNDYQFKVVTTEAQLAVLRGA